jgi:hypothetical protein
MRAQASLFETKNLLSETIQTLRSVESASNVVGNVLQRDLRSNGEAKPLQSNYYMDNSLAIPLAKCGSFRLIARSVDSVSLKRQVCSSNFGGVGLLCADTFFL